MSGDFSFDKIGNMKKMASNNPATKGSLSGKNEPRKKMFSTVYTSSNV